MNESGMFNREESASGHPTLLTLNRGLAILDLLATCRNAAGMTHAQIADRLRFRKSTLYRYLANLQGQRYVELVEDTPCYRLGPKALGLAAAAVRQRGFEASAQGFVDALAAATGEMAHATVFDNGDSVTVAIADGGGPIGPRISVGSRRPAHLSASGKVFLAFGERRVLDRYLEAPLRAATTNSISTATQLFKEVSAVRDSGFSVDRAEFVDGICCVAAPVSDLSGRVRGSLSVSIAAPRLDDARILDLSMPLLKQARRFSQFLSGEGE